MSLPAIPDKGTCPACGAPWSDERLKVCAACLLAIAAGSGFSESPTSTATGSASAAAEAAPRLAPGQIFGPYRIERLLGRGGMGEVYEAVQREHGRRVAVKVVTGRLTDPVDRSRFLREGQLAASVHHSNSVYVFGAEEIDGVAVIAMELLAGGTLKDRVERTGAMDPAEAVDAMLQVIAGLDAAHQAGVLHRDVKPSNCFLSLDGTVKIGDFGLSISALPQRPTSLTASSVIRATPQFAAPEQLKGEPLDVRADIYAVGGTLHYLLTGHAPFEADTLGSLLARVLSEPAPSARALQPAVPAGVDRIVARCLAKEPADRPPDYAWLHHALRPFSTEAAVPAPRSLRFAAGAIDHLVLFPVAGAVALGASQPTLGLQAVGFVAWVVYFAILEGIWGASVGKWLCGLRVARATGRGTAGVGRALLRAVLYALVWHVPAVALFAIDRSDWSGGPAAVARLIGLSLPYLLLALLFSPARRNRFAGGWDRLTSTSVVIDDVRLAPPIIDVEERVCPGSDPPNFGPYRVVGEISAARPGRLLLACDDALKRRVWIHATTGVPAVSLTRRDLARTGRLRWLTGVRAGTAGWDAYEAADGATLRQIAGWPQPWRLVKRWLIELAREIDAGVADGTLQSLAVDRVWITKRGQAVVLDYAVGPPLMPELPTDVKGRQQFLQQVASAALMGWRDSGPVAIERPLPLPAAAALAALGATAFDSFHGVRAAFEDLLHRPDEVSRRRRAASLLLPGVPLFLSVLVVTFVLLRFRGLAGSAAGVTASDLSWLFVQQMAIVAALAGVTALASRGGVVLRWWGIGVTTGTGKPASRARVVWRTFVAWSPVLASALILGMGVQPRTALLTVVVAMLLMLCGVVWAVLEPGRGLQDRIAATWLVPG